MSIQASSNALTLAGVTPVGIAISGSNPAMVMINDAGQLYNARTGSLASSGVSIAGNVTITGDLYTQRLNVGIVTQYGTLDTRTGFAFGETVNVVSENTATSGTTPLCSSFFGSTFTPSSNSSAGLTTVRIVNRLAPPSPVNFSNTNVAAYSGVFVARNAGTIGALQGIRNQVRYLSGSASGTVSAIIGVRSDGLIVDNAASTGPSSVVAVQGVSALGLSIGALTGPIAVTTSSAFYVIASSYPAATTVTNQYGLYVEAITLPATANAAIRLNGVSGASNNYGLWFGTNTANVGSGIAWGTAGDVSLYRNAASVLETPGDMRVRHTRSTTTPTIAAGAGAGTTPTIAISGTDLGFQITLTQGNPTATGIIATVTFGNTWTTAPNVTFSAADPDSAALTGTSCPYVTTTATTAVFNSGSVGLVAGTQYIWKFVTGPAN